MQHDPAEELVEVVDRDNQLIAVLSRRIMRRQRLTCRAAYILVFNTAEELFVQQRALDKDLYPGYWDPAAGGVVLAGESYEQAALRELREELGLQRVRLQFLFDQYFEDADNSVWGRIFSCVHNGPFALQAEEIIDGRFLSLEAVSQLQQAEPFTPDGALLLERLA